MWGKPCRHGDVTGVCDRVLLFSPTSNSWLASSPCNLRASWSVSQHSWLIDLITLQLEHSEHPTAPGTPAQECSYTPVTPALQWRKDDQEREASRGYLTPD